MGKLAFSDDMLEKLIVADLVKTYKLSKRANPDDLDIQQALLTVIKFYSVPGEFEKLGIG
jgi:hypothetical protein